jgi:hypothetical protein
LALSEGTTQEIVGNYWQRAAGRSEAPIALPASALT